MSTNSDEQQPTEINNATIELLKQILSKHFSSLKIYEPSKFEQLWNKMKSKHSLLKMEHNAINLPKGITNNKITLLLGSQLKFQGGHTTKCESMELAFEELFLFLRKLAHLISYFRANYQPNSTSKKKFVEQLIEKNHSIKLEQENCQNNWRITLFDTIYFVQSQKQLVCEKFVEFLSKISKFKTSNQEVKPKIEIVPKQQQQQQTLNNKTIKQIYEAVNQKWKSLGSKPFRVLASFVLTSNDSTNPEVLAIATGSKCVPAERLVLDGSVVHDSHAEIIARRALKLVLYDHLKHLTKSIGPIRNEKELILERVPNKSNRYRLKSGYKLHLMITMNPCGGDGALQVKLEAYSGYPDTMSVETFPTWNQMQNGKQVASFMTCSDKILMWNVCGVQGSILAKFIEPIYIDNVIINSKQTSIETVKKLLYGRLNQQKMNDKLKQFRSFGYKFKCNTIHYYKPENHDQIFNSSLDKKSPKAYNWYKIIGKVGMIETINSQTGTLHGNEQHHSQLSKRSFLAQYLSLPKPLLNSTNNEPNPMNGLFWSRMKRTYRGIKEQSIQYQLVKKEFIDTVKESELGQWIQVDVSIDLFVADLPSLK